MPIVLDETPACQHSSCANASDGQHLALSRQELQEKSPKLCLFQVPFSSPTLEVLQELEDQKSVTRSTGKVSFAKAGRIMVENPKLRAMVAKARRTKAVAAGEIAEPKSTREALERDHEAWLPSIVEEIQPLFDKDVLCQGEVDKGYTKAELLKKASTSTLDLQCTLVYTTLTNTAVKAKLIGTKPDAL